MVIFNFWFIWSFAASACGRHRKIRTQKKNFWHSGYSGRQKKYCTNVIKTTPNMDRVMGTWFELLNNCHMTKNTELEFKQRTDIYCDKLERILLPPYIFIERRGGKWTVCNLGSWFWPNFRANRLCERKDTWKYTFGSVMSYSKKHDSFPVDVRRSKTSLFKPCRNICITGKQQIISFQKLWSFRSWCVKYHNKRNRSAYKLWNPSSGKHSRA